MSESKAVESEASARMSVAAWMDLVIYGYAYHRIAPDGTVKHVPFEDVTLGDDGVVTFPDEGVRE